LSIRAAIWFKRNKSVLSSLMKRQNKLAFITVKPIQPDLTFAVKARSLPQLGSSLRQVLALITNIRPSARDLTLTNTPAYFQRPPMTKERFD
jgi:hypothetical protein